MTTKSVLYVEDNADNQFLVGLYTKKTRYELSVATTAEEGLSIIHQKHFDAIILDVNLSGDMTGMEFLNAVRKEAVFEKTAVIIVSGLPSAGHVPGLEDGTYQCFLPKPFRKQELLDVLDRIFNEND
jgi:two-component system response regulator AtoC